MGPFQTIHLNAPEGIAGYVKRYEKMYGEMFNKSDIEWSSIVKHGLEEELLKLYQPSDREKHEKDRDTKLAELILHKTKAKNPNKFQIAHRKQYFLYIFQYYLIFCATWNRYCN